MQAVNIKIKKQNIVSSNIFISQHLSKQFELNMACKAKIKTSKDPVDKIVLLNIEVIISTKDEELKMELVADTFFELEQLPDDYSEMAEQKLVPMAIEKLLISLDDILVVMGYNKMELAKKSILSD